MDILIVLIFISLTLVASAVVFFVWTVGQRTYEHNDRMSLLPLDEGHPADRKH